MKAFIQMTAMHPFASIWLAMTMVLWLAIYLSTRTKTAIDNHDRRR